MSWTQFCKDYSQKNGVPYKNALKEASAPYQQYKQQMSQQPAQPVAPKKKAKVAPQPQPVMEQPVVAQEEKKKVVKRNVKTELNIK